MIKKIDKDHPMYKYAFYWCIFNYTDGMKLAELLEFFQLVSGIDGDDWEEVTIKNGGSGLYKRFLTDLVTEGKDWYWCWSSVHRSQIDVFLTTEKQASYFALTQTTDWNKDQLPTASLLSRIRARKNKSRPKIINYTDPSATADRILTKIRARSAKHQ